MARITYKLFYNTSAKVGGHKGWSIAVGIDQQTQYYLNFKKPEHWDLSSFAPNAFRHDLRDRIIKINEGSPENEWTVLADFKARYNGTKSIQWTAVLSTYNASAQLLLFPWTGVTNPVEYALKPYSYFNDGNSSKAYSAGKSAPAFMFIDNHDPLGLARYQSRPNQQQSVAAAQPRADGLGSSLQF